MIRILKKLPTRIRSHELYHQGIRYLLVGVWNTVFGVGGYSLLLWFFGETHYLLLGVAANILAVTNAYVCYKFFVFKTKGNVIREYIRCYLVYGGGMLLGFALMIVCVSVLKFNAIISNIVLCPIIFLISFVGHKFFSFRPLTIEEIITEEPLK